MAAADGTLKTKSRYVRILEAIFLDRYKKGARSVEFNREDLSSTAGALGIELPKNLGDVLYSFRYRKARPAALAKTCGPGEAWELFPNGTSRYVFRRIADAPITLSKTLPTLILGATPQVIAKYAQSDEQALLAIVRYNRLLDTFAGVTAYSLQNHLRTSVQGLGQIEIDELYIGVDRNGRYSVFPVQAKSPSDKLGVVQVFQDIQCCREKYPDLECHPIGVQLLAGGDVAMFELELTKAYALKIRRQRRFRLIDSKT